MSELLEIRLEEMLPELEQMESLQLFDKTEIRSILKRRREYETKLQRQNKTKDDFLLYIHYEIEVLKLARSRQSHFYTYISSMLGPMLQAHSDKPFLWKFAAQLEFEDMHSVENARQYLLRGLRFHPECRLLYLEAFKLELVYAQMKCKERLEKKEKLAVGAKEHEQPKCDQAMEVSGSSSQAVLPDGAGHEFMDQVLEGKHAEVIYEAAVKRIHDVSFVISFLNTCKEFDFTENLQRKIVNDLLSTYPTDELTWDIMARRELEGLSYSDSAPTSATVHNKKQDRKKKKKISREQIRLCTAVYQAGVKQINTEKMWSLYLDQVIDLNHDTSSLPVFKKKLLREAFQGAHSAGKMQEKYYRTWMEILYNAGKRKKLDAVLRSVTERLPKSVDMWQLRMKFHQQYDDEAAVIRVFHDAIMSLSSEESSTLVLWKKLILYYQTKENAKVESVFKEGMLQGPAVSLPLKIRYLEWVMLAKGITAARTVYESLCFQSPFCLGLHTKMASLECTQPEIKMNYVRKCYDLACEQFGKTNTDIWMEYVKFEHIRGDAKNVSNLYLRAIKTLEPMQTDSFISEFNLLKTGLASVKS
uniref:U3 small nucleolar RNA-associated protein 6 homolog n=2 Tax=Timema TaxID=61471 RepID=A0A7R9AW99_TIMSH|nr:unnamed protein product [Timema shepardi]